ncbi:MAG: phage distal tail protein [Candidatus Hodarchaeales archaeon]
MSEESQDIKFNNHSLQTTSDPSATILTSNIIYNNLPEKILNLKEDSIRDGWSLADVRYSNKVITINGWLISDSGENLKTLIDNFKNYLRPNEKNLDIETYPGSGEYIRWIATTRAIRIPEEHWQVTQKPFEVEFLCQPFGKATTSTTINLNSGSNITTSPYSEDISITGTYDCKPIITFTIVSETNLTALKFENDTNDDWIQVSTSFSTSDVLEIDCENETVKLNSVNQDFTGVFPRLKPGTNSLIITTTDSGSFALTVDITYYPTYL